MARPIPHRPNFTCLRKLAYVQPSVADRIRPLDAIRTRENYATFTIAVGTSFDATLTSDTPPFVLSEIMARPL